MVDFVAHSKATSELPNPSCAASAWATALAQPDGVVREVECIDELCAGREVGCPAVEPAGCNVNLFAVIASGMAAESFPVSGNGDDGYSHTGSIEYP
ncbi:hypothetical protein NUW58_g10221 [Xylaria curta]|uniref:Uncharacterized protein n=1 Tax=Xylaria curta TaxID=42375 RepID=A0ACC1MPI5_9PEZI|nr:hypothetical protein NUW58_g10221 [Xylaria curta]